jgi:hypothetical protein
MNLPVEMLVEIAIWMEHPGRLLTTSSLMMRQLDAFSRHPYRWIASLAEAVDNDDPYPLTRHADVIRDDSEKMRFVIEQICLSSKPRLVKAAFKMFGGAAWMCITTQNDNYCWYSYSISNTRDSTEVKLITPAVVQYLMQYHNICADRVPVIFPQYISISNYCGFRVKNIDGCWLMCDGDTSLAY